MAFTKTAGVEYGTPAVVLSTTAASGSNQTAIRTDGQIIAFSTDTPEPVGLTASAGTDAVAARLDHIHVGTEAAGTTVDETIARYDGTAGAIQGYTSDGPTIGDTGIMKLTGQPAVLVYRTEQITNVTGDGTTYTIVFDGETYDQGYDMTTTTFTAPVDGIYLFGLSVNCNGLAADQTYIQLYIQTSNRSCIGGARNPGISRNVNNDDNFGFTIITEMDAADTAYCTIRILNGSKVVDLGGSTGTYNTWFNAQLLA